MILNWLNSVLAEAETGVRPTNVCQDFRDPHLFAKAVEVLIGKPIAINFLREPTNQNDLKCENMNMVLQALADEGVDMMGTTAENIVDGNVNRMMDLFFHMAKRFAVSDLEGEALHVGDDESAKGREQNGKLNSELPNKLLTWTKAQQQEDNQTRVARQQAVEEQQRSNKPPPVITGTATAKATAAVESICACGEPFSVRDIM